MHVQLLSELPKECRVCFSCNSLG